MSTLNRNLRASLGDGAFFSLMVGMGETYLVAFALSLYASEIAAGLLGAMPILAGAVLQLWSPPLIRSFGSHRVWVVACAVCQAISLLILPLAIFCGPWSIVLLYVAASLYWGTGQATGPAWNVWMEELIPHELRARFFAHRSRICQTCVLIGFVCGGLILEFGAQHEASLAAFSVILILAAASRLTSAYCLACHSDPSGEQGMMDQVGVRQLLREWRGNEGAKLCAYLFAVQVAVQISGPYFAPFMLAQLELNYATFMLLVSLSFVGKVLALPAWGKLAHRAGARALMWIGGIAIVPLPALWLGVSWIANPIPYLCVVQIVGGVAWAAYELAFFLMFFETIPRNERISGLTLYNVGNALATAVGAVLGACTLGVMGESLRSYFLLFATSSVCRILALGILLRVPRMHIDVVVPALRILSLRSSDDTSMDRPVLPTIPPRPRETVDDERAETTVP